MAVKKNFLDRFSERLDDLDANSRQAYILRLAKERGFFETIFNAVDEGIMVIDRRLRIRYFNRAARELLALPENIAELRVSQLLQGIDWKRILQEDEEEWMRVARQEIEILYPVRRFLQFYLVPYPEDTGLAAVILRDVTDSRAKTMDELKTETVKAVSMLAAGVAHEIGNPLNSLYLNLQILEKTYSHSDDSAGEEAAEMIRICKSEVERLDSIIHGFLTAIRPGKPTFAPVNVQEIVCDVLTFMRPEIEARLVKVHSTWSNVIPAIPGDAAQLKQAFYNIIRNAVQAMSNGGELQICGSADPEFLSIEFLDSGKGVTAEEISTMFNAFKTNKAGGNGIGTMIIERVFREHGAEFGLESIPGKGTLFQVRFPLGGRRVRMLAENLPESDL
ncbi:MAG: PAS domain-containing protein [Lentisphaeria bacterium]|nr:PAS domain-containing protein [Lentisphaeria bacterium]